MPDRFNFHHHAALTSGDEHTQYLRSAGRSGGQNIVGGTGGGEALKLQGVASETDYTEVEADGTVKFVGAATVWNDLRVPVTSTKKGGAKEPQFKKAFDDAGGTSQGVYAEFFDKDAEEELFLIAQIPHTYKEGTDIIAHIHWFPASTGASGKTVSWGLEYIWLNIAATAGDTVIVYADDTIQGDAVLVGGKHYMTNFAALTGTGKTISSVLICRIFRDATSAGGTDDYTDEVGLLEVDFHYEIDTAGSRGILTK